MDRNAFLAFVATERGRFPIGYREIPDRLYGDSHGNPDHRDARGEEMKNSIRRHVCRLMEFFT
jgi:hypothetical protein